MNKTALCLMALMSWLPCIAAAAPKQTADGLPVYQVELIVFAREESNMTSDAEHWPKDILLRYPPLTQTLIDPEAEARKSALEDALPPMDTGANSVAAEDENTKDEPSPESEGYFTFLSEDSRTLNDSAKAIDRRNHLQVLFHEAWRQPMLPAEEAPALVIRGGKEYMDHRELEGHVTLSVSRYLHIHTDLWLVDFTPNIGQLPEFWPVIPRAPGTELDGIPDGYNNSNAQGFGEFSLNPAIDNSSSNKSATNNRLFNTPSLNLDWNLGGGLQQNPYLVEAIYTMRQKRRMRSNERHYIDHPRMGIIVLITPFEIADR